MITIWYCNDIDSPFRFHRDCLGARPWLNQTERKYDSLETLINDLITHKNHFWCHRCEKGMFFPISCIEHDDTEVAEVAEEEGEEEGIAVL